MKSLFETLKNDLDIFHANINNIILDINVINSRTKNIYTENAVINDVLKYNGNNWIPSNDATSSGVQSLILAHETSAASSATVAAIAASEALAHKIECFPENAGDVLSATRAFNFNNDAAASAVTAETAKNDLVLAASPTVNRNSPDFTGTVNLPSGAKINGIPISISNKIRSKAVRAYTRGAPDFREPESRPDNQLLHVHFHDIEANTYGTPTLGNTVGLWSGTASLWNKNTETNVSGVTPDRIRNYFKVPSGRDGNYQITINVMEEYSFGEGNGFKSEHYLYRRRNSVDTIISYKVFEFHNDPTSVYAGMLKHRTESIDNVFELEGGDELFVMVKADLLGVVQQHQWYWMYRLMGRRTDHATQTGVWDTSERTNFIVTEL